MIITAIIVFFASVCSFFISLIPNMRIDVSPEFQDSWVSIVNNVSALVPTNHLFIILALVALIYGAEFLWLLLNWIIAKIPFIE
jgi:hypothetical protein